MPTYVYRREDGTTFEITQRITEDALTVDPETGQRVERVIGGGGGLIFKGSGFYLTDYARAGKGGEKASSEKGSDGKASGEKSDGGAGASKPETAAAKPASGSGSSD